MEMSKMNTGMLWFDNDPKTDLKSKIAQAVTYYQQKYGKHPDLCFVHPSVYSESTARTNGVEVRPNRLIRPHHLWVGIQEAGVAA
jgi:hypothetical protein